MSASIHADDANFLAEKYPLSLLPHDDADENAGAIEAETSLMQVESDWVREFVGNASKPSQPSELGSPLRDRSFSRESFTPPRKDEQRAALLQDDDIMTKVLQASFRACNEILPAGVKSPCWQRFENESDPEVEYDFGERECPLMDSLMTLVSVTTFLAGFIAVDFSGFTVEMWQDAPGAVPLVYISFLAFAEGCCLYLSICGTLAGVTFQRARNQEDFWEAACKAAVAPVTENLQFLKGRREEAYKATINNMVKMNANWRHDFLYLGVAKHEDDISLCVWLQHIEKPDSTCKYVLTCSRPSVEMGTWLAFRYVGCISFPMAMFCYVFTQTLKALTGTQPHTAVCVLAILGVWLLRTGNDILGLYKKIRD